MSPISSHFNDQHPLSFYINVRYINQKFNEFINQKFNELLDPLRYELILSKNAEVVPRIMRAD